jgi:hypothetical protein
MFCDFKTDEKAVHGSCRKRLDRLPISRSAWWWAEGQTKWNVFGTGSTLVKLPQNVG